MPILNQVLNLISSLSFFIWSELIAIFISFYTISLLYKKGSEERNFLYNTKHLLVTIIAASILEDVSWLLNTLKLTILPQLNLSLILLIIRIAWIFAIIQYQSFNLFIEYLIPNQSKFLIIINRLTSFICTIYSILLTGLIIFKSDSLTRTTLEDYLIINITNIYMPVMTLICIVFTLITFKELTITQDLRKTLYSFALGFVWPTILADTMHIYRKNIEHSIVHDYTLIAFSALFIAITAFFYTCLILKKPLTSDEL